MNEFTESNIPKEPLTLIIRFTSGDNLVLGNAYNYQDGDNEILTNLYDAIFKGNYKDLSVKFHDTKYMLKKDFIVMAELKRSNI